jgi:hypothetical protein
MPGNIMAMIAIAPAIKRLHTQSHRDKAGKEVIPHHTNNQIKSQNK